MKGIIYKIIDSVTGKLKLPVTIDKAVYTDNGDSIDEAYVKKDSDGELYQGERIDLYGHHYSYEGMGYIAQSSPSGAIQGGDVFGDKFYQFYDGLGVMVVDIATKTNEDYFVVPNSIFDSIHCGQVCFSNEYENEGDELPLVYVSDALIGTDYYEAVININGGADSAHIVRYFKITGICAFDFVNKKGWAFGYNEESSSGATSHKGMKYKVTEFTFPTEGDGDISDSVVIASDFVEVPNLGKANLQDVTYHNGRVYVLAGGSYNRYVDDNGNLSDEIHIGCYDIWKKTFVSNIKIPPFETTAGLACVGESESLGIYGNGFIMGTIKNASSSNSYWKITL